MSFDSLLHRFLDDRSSLAPEELDTLVAALRADPARAVELREQLLVDDLVAQKLALDRRNFLAQVEQRIADYEHGQDEIDAQVADVRSIAEAEIHSTSAWSGTPAWMLASIALAVAAVVAAVILVPGLFPLEDRAVAKVTALAGEVQWNAAGKSLPLAVGAPLITGREISTRPGGTLQLAYDDQTTLALGGETRITLGADPKTSAKRVTIAEGQVVASVTSQSAGAMTFTTPHAVATVLGTELRLTVTADRTLLDVGQGKVQLDRLNTDSPIVVETHETGIATGLSLTKQKLRWPDEHRQAITFLIDPFLQVNRQFSFSRDPATRNFYDTAIEAHGQARINDFTGGLETAGGWFSSEEAGADLLALQRDQREFTLEIVLQSVQKEAAGQARIVALADDGTEANFALSQEQGELVFSLRTDAPQRLEPLRWSVDSSAEPIHLTITYRAGQLLAYHDGVVVARSSPHPGAFTNWHEGILTLGADQTGASHWDGTVHAVACYNQCLEIDAILRNVRSFQALQAH